MGEIKNRIMGFCKEIIEDSKNYGIYNIEYNFKIYNSTLVIDAKNIGTKNSYSVATSINNFIYNDNGEFVDMSSEIVDFIKSYFNELVYTFDINKCIVKSTKLHSKTSKLIKLSQYSKLNYGSKELIRLFSKLVVDNIDKNNNYKLSIRIKEMI